jgi:hypothetical protein
MSSGVLRSVGAAFTGPVPRSVTIGSWICFVVVSGLIWNTNAPV